MMTLTTQDSLNLAAAKRNLEAAMKEYEAVVAEIVEANENITEVEEKRMAYDFTGSYKSRR